MAASGWNPKPEKDPLSDSLSPVEKKLGRRPQILLVEDNRPDVLLTLEALAEAGIEADFHIANDGQDAIQLLDDADRNETVPCPDLVILDLNLPRKNGQAVLQHLRRSKRCSGAMVLVATSSDSPRDRDAMRALGAEAYFRKPSDYDEYKKVGGIVKLMLAGIRPA